MPSFTRSRCAPHARYGPCSSPASVSRCGRQPARVGDAGIRLRARRRGAGDRQPGLSRAGARIRADAVALGRRLRHRGRPRQPDARHRAAGGAALPRAAPRHPRRCLAGFPGARRRSGHRVATGEILRPGDDPVHLGHDRLHQGRAAAPPRAGEQRRAHGRAHGHPRRCGMDHDDAAVPHRRLRVLRARRGVGARHQRAGRGFRARAGARAVRHLQGRCDGWRADDAGGDDGPPVVRRHRHEPGAGHLLRRLDRARGAGAALRGPAEGAVHHRLRPDRMFAGGDDDAARRQRRGQGRHDRHAAAACRGEERRSGQRAGAAGGPGRRVPDPRLPRDARLLRERRGR